MDPQELVPLESGLTPQSKPSRQCSHVSTRSCFRPPLRICRLLALLIVLPCMFLLIPLYLRYRVYSRQMYPMSMTDMRLIDSKISPTWCQRQVVKSNATFNAFVVPGQPELGQELVPVTMTRQLELEDDMKEYWGFYLLKGSSVTVSACVSWPGASLIMIKGYKHLQECAYIGDDSSEELDELLEANKLGLLSDAILKEKIQQLKKVDGKANDPETMKRHKAGVSFHDPSRSTNVTSSENVPSIDVTDHDSKELQQILEHLHAVREAAKIEALKYYHPPSHLITLPALHRHRDANVDKDERKWLKFQDIDGNNSEQQPISNNTNIISNITENSPKFNTIDGANIEIKEQNVNKTDNINATFKQDDSTVRKTDNIDATVKQDDSIVRIDILASKITKVEEPIDDSTKTNINNMKTVLIKDTTISNIETGATEGVISVTENSYKAENTIQSLGKITNNKAQIESEEMISSAEEVSSKEVFQDVLTRLQSLGDRGKRVLIKLHESLGVEYKEQSPSSTRATLMSNVQGSAEELDRLRHVLVEAIDEEKNHAKRRQRRHDARIEAGAKRELMLGQIDLQKELNEDDEARDYAAEEGLVPDGYAEHHEQVNETTPYDMSNSEFWSSFSSSEEALLECEGLILNLPLTPHSSCRSDVSDEEALTAAKANALTYRVPANGYYFFVFNSENEVQRNFIKARFDLQKTRYDVARTTLRECRNSTEQCNLALDIFSTQKVVLEVPLRDNDSLWNEQFLIISECEPRTSIYIVCVIAVPLLIMVFAFQ